MRLTFASVAAVAALLTGCSAGSSPTASEATASHSHPTAAASPPAEPTPEAVAPAINGLPGMPPVTDAHDVYAAAGAGMLSAVTRTARPMVYVPHNSGTVWEI